MKKLTRFVITRDHSTEALDVIERADREAAERFATAKYGEGVAIVHELAADASAPAVVKPSKRKRRPR